MKAFTIPKPGFKRGPKPGMYRNRTNLGRKMKIRMPKNSGFNAGLGKLRIK